MKFGGSSVGTPEAMRQSAKLIAAHADRSPVVAVLALQGVTDQLIAAAKAAAAGDEAASKDAIDALRGRHLAQAAAFGSEGLAATRKIEALIDGCAAALAAIVEAGAVGPEQQDEIVSFGERLAAPLLAAAVRAEGVDAADFDARGLIATDDRFTSADVDFPETNRRIREALLERASVPSASVVTGFIGSAPDGRTTTIGRGGTDYTASILGGALGAEEIWIWKEVDGIMTADPRVVPDAAVLDDISYDEAAEMSYFGAKVLHPKTMIPAIRGAVPMRLRNTFRPEVPGTRIGFSASRSPDGVKSVTAVKGLAVVTVEGKGMAGIAGFAARVFSTAGRLRISILMFSQSSSEQSICLVVRTEDAAPLKEALMAEFRGPLASHDVEDIRIEAPVAAVAVVGDGMRGRPGTAAAMLGAVAEGGINVRAIAQGSSERNISIIVAEGDADRSVRAIHRAFNLERLVCENVRS